MHISYIYTYVPTSLCMCVHLKYVSKYIPLGFIKDHTHNIAAIQNTYYYYYDSNDIGRYINEFIKYIRYIYV